MLIILEPTPIKTLIESHLTSDQITSSLIKKALFGAYEEIYDFVKRSKLFSKVTTPATNDGEWYFRCRTKDKRYTVYFYPTNEIRVMCDNNYSSKIIHSIEEFKSYCNI